MRNLSLLAVTALTLAAAGLIADEPRHTGDNDQKFTDKSFVEKAAMDNMFEVKAGQLAEQRAMSPQVKQFAQRMVTDHTRANQELMALARQKGWQVPTALDQKHQELFTRLQNGGRSGNQPAAGGTGAAAGQFDRQYMEMQLKGHEKDVREFEKATQQAKDPQLKSWAQKTLPVIQEHLQMAKQITQGWSGTGTNAGTGTGTRTVPPAGGTTRPVPPTR